MLYWLVRFLLKREVRVVLEEHKTCVFFMPSTQPVILQFVSVALRSRDIVDRTSGNIFSMTDTCFGEMSRLKTFCLAENIFVTQ